MVETEVLPSGRTSTPLFDTDAATPTEMLSNEPGSTKTVSSKRKKTDKKEKKKTKRKKKDL